MNIAISVYSTHATYGIDKNNNNDNNNNNNNKTTKKEGTS